MVGFLDKKADSEHHMENSPFRQNPETTAPETPTPVLEISPTLETRKTSETGPLPPPYPPLATPMPSAGLSVPTGNTRIPGQPRPAQCGWVNGGSGRGDAGRPAKRDIAGAREPWCPGSTFVGDRGAEECGWTGKGGTGGRLNTM